MNKLSKLLGLVFRFIIYVFASILPKKNKLWVFGAWFGQKYSDNPKVFFEYINKHQPSIDAVWVTKSNEVIRLLSEKGYRVYHERSIQGIFCSLRADYAFICQAYQDDLYAPCIGKKTTVVNLWHGLPIKKIMFDVLSTREYNKNIVGRLTDILSPYERYRNDYLISTNSLTQSMFSKAFMLPKSRVLVTGFPRNDVFFNHKINEKSKTFKCIYMPTLRGWKGDSCDLFESFGFDINLIDKILKQYNIELVLRMHPVNKPPNKLVQDISCSEYVSIDTSADIYDTIAEYDCLVTDYSSICFDFLLSNKPIVFAPFDLEHYMATEKSLYFDYESVSVKPFSKNWIELINRLVELSKEPSMPEYYKVYNNLKSNFHDVGENKKYFYSEKLFNTLSRL